MAESEKYIIATMQRRITNTNRTRPIKPRGSTGGPPLLPVRPLSTSRRTSWFTRRKSSANHRRSSTQPPRRRQRERRARSPSASKPSVEKHKPHRPSRSRQSPIQWRVPTRITDDMHLEKDKKLGQGTFGQVHSLKDVRTGRPAGRVMKVSLISNDREEEIFDREVLYLERLQDTEWQQELVSRYRSMSRWMPLVPRLYWRTTELLPNGQKQGVQVMGQWDGTLTDLGIEQAKAFRLKDGVAFTRHQLLSMIALVHALDRQSIVHGDLKRRNMLFKRGHTDPRNVTIVLSDFGFSGILKEHRRVLSDVNFSPKIGFPEALGYWSRRLPRKLWAYLNRWQMYYDAVHNRPTYLIRTDTPPVQNESRSSLASFQRSSSLPIPHSAHEPLVASSKSAPFRHRSLKSDRWCQLVSDREILRLLHLPEKVVQHFRHLIETNPDNPERLHRPHRWIDTRTLAPYAIRTPHRASTAALKHSSTKFALAVAPSQFPLLPVVAPVL